MKCRFYKNQNIRKGPLPFDKIHIKKIESAEKSKVFVESYRLNLLFQIVAHCLHIEPYGQNESRRASVSHS